MKLYYIDDTMFQSTLFQEEMRTRFIFHLRKHRVQMIFISNAHKETQALQDFITHCKNIPVVMSPALFDFDQVKGNLHTTFLAIEGYPPMQTYSGTCVEYDTETKTCQRIYFDMFANQHQEEDFDYLVDELEKVIQEKVKGMKKKKNLSN